MYVNLENAVSVYWSERDKGTIVAFVGGEKMQSQSKRSLNRSSRTVERFALLSAAVIAMLGLVACLLRHGERAMEPKLVTA